MIIYEGSKGLVLSFNKDVSLTDTDNKSFKLGVNENGTPAIQIGKREVSEDVPVTSKLILNGAGFDTFDEAIESLIEGKNELTLYADCEIGKAVSIKNNVELVLDLAGYNLNRAESFADPDNEGAEFTIYRLGKLVIKGEGTITGANQVKLTSKNDADKDATHIAAFELNDATLYCTNYYAVCGNGSRHGVEVVMNSGKIICDTREDKDTYGMFIPSAGTVTINGGEIVAGSCAIELRTGNLVINGGKFTATQTTETTCVPNGNGSTTHGAAIAVAQHTTKYPIDAKINGGEFNGYTAFYEANPQGNPQEALDKITLAINGGKLVGTASVYSQDKEHFVAADVVCNPECEEKYKK